MKRLLILATASFAIFLFAPSAKAELFSIALDVPLQYKFDAGVSADDVSGYKAAVNLPFLVGFGFEDYTVTLNTAGLGGTSREIGITLFDVFLDLPTPLINLGIGLGAGTAESVDAATPTEEFDGTVIQAFVTIGIPIYELFDVHIGYHLLSGTLDNKNSASSEPTFVLDGDMLSLGVRVGF